MRPAVAAGLSVQAEGTASFSDILAGLQGNASADQNETAAEPALPLTDSSGGLRAKAVSRPVTAGGRWPAATILQPAQDGAQNGPGSLLDAAAGAAGSGLSGQDPAAGVDSGTALSKKTSSDSEDAGFSLPLSGPGRLDRKSQGQKEGADPAARSVLVEAAVVPVAGGSLNQADIFSTTSSTQSTRSATPTSDQSAIEPTAVLPAQLQPVQELQPGEDLTQSQTQNARQAQNAQIQDRAATGAQGLTLSLKPVNRSTELAFAVRIQGQSADLGPRANLPSASAEIPPKTTALAATDFQSNTVDTPSQAGSPAQQAGLRSDQTGMPSEQAGGPSDKPGDSSYKPRSVAGQDGISKASLLPGGDVPPATADANASSHPLTDTATASDGSDQAFAANVAVPNRTMRWMSKEAAVEKTGERAAAPATPGGVINLTAVPMTGVSNDAAQGRPPQAAETESPAAVTAEEPALTRPAIKEVQLQITSAADQHVDLKLVEKSGSLSMSVRSSDAAVTKALQQNLPELASQFSDQQIRAEFWRPDALTDSKQQFSGSSSQGQHSAAGDQGAGSQGNPNRGHSGKQGGNAPPPDWLDEVTSPQETIQDGTQYSWHL